MLNLPLHILIVFIGTALLTVFLLSGATWNGYTQRVKNRTLPVAFLSIMWLLFVSILALFKYFLSTDSIPPHIAIPVLCTLGIITAMFAMKRGRRFLDGLSLRWLTWLHIIRVPVELTLWWLAIEKQVPFSMTFKGTNFDILSGLSAPIMAYLYFNRKAIGPKVMIVWNCVALLLLLNVVVDAVLSVPSPIQTFNLDQPNWAILNFPFAWLPAYIVPVVLFSHLVALRQLTRPSRVE